MESGPHWIKREKQMPLEMKYFVLKPRSKSPGDRYALAAREGMRAYALTIHETDPELCHELLKWIDREEDRVIAMTRIG